MFASMGRPRDWFGYSLASFVVTWTLYVYDYRLILRQRGPLASDAAGRAVYEHVIRRQRHEMWVLMPAGVKGNPEETALRRLGEPADVARAVRYCIDADFFTGQELVIDGGRLLRP